MTGPGGHPDFDGGLFDGRPQLRPKFDVLPPPGVRAHTAEEPAGDGPRGRCYGPGDPGILSDTRVGKGLKYFTKPGCGPTLYTVKS